MYVPFKCYTTVRFHTLVGNMHMQNVNENKNRSLRQTVSSQLDSLLMLCETFWGTKIAWQMLMIVWTRCILSNKS